MPKGLKIDAVYDELLQRLTSGTYRFGDAIVAKTVSEETRASRFLVISALNTLRAQGFVRIIPQVGCEVVRPSAREVRDFFAMLACLGGLSAQFAAERRPSSDVDLLAQVAGKVEAVDVGLADAAQQLTRLRDRFVGLVGAFARSPALAERQGGHWAMASFLAAQIPRPAQSPQAVAAALRTVADAIAASNPPAARAAMESWALSFGERVTIELEGAQLLSHDRAV